MSQARSVAYYLSNHTRTMVVAALLVLEMLVDLGAAVSTFGEVRLLAAMEAGRAVSERAQLLNDLLQAAVGLIEFAVFVGTAVAFCFWIYRAHENLGALGASGLQFTPAWAAGWFFVPVMSLFRPYQVMREIWKGSGPAAGQAYEAPGVQGDSWALVKWWWGLYLLMNFSALPAVWGAAGDPAAALRADYFVLASYFAAVAAAAVTIALVRAVDERQERRAAALRGGAAPAGETSW